MSSNDIMYHSLGTHPLNHFGVWSVEWLRWYLYLPEVGDTIDELFMLTMGGEMH